MQTLSKADGDSVAHFHSPLGIWCIAARLGMICAITPCPPGAPTDSCAKSRADARALDLASHWLDAYFAGNAPQPLTLPLLFQGTSFQQAIWSLLCVLPFGATCAYGDLARLHAQENALSPMSARAVGNAVGANRLAIVVPCHRVIHADGSIGGFGWGAALKLALLEHEGVHLQDVRKKTVARNSGA